MVDVEKFLLNNYHVGLEACARRLNMSEEALLSVAPNRVLEYWSLVERTSSYDSLITKFSALCKELNLTEASALITLNRRFRK